MSRRLLGYNPDTGMSVWWHETADDWAIEYSQDVTAVLDANKEAQNHGDPRWKSHEGRWVARIPMVVIEQWRQLYGIDYFDRDPAVQRRIDQLLSSNEWRHLRVDNSRLA